MNKASCTLPPRAPRQVSRFLKVIPLAAFLAAPAVWAIPTGGTNVNAPDAASYIGEKGATGNDVSVDADWVVSEAFSKNYGGFSRTEEVKENFLTIELDGNIVLAMGGYTQSDQPATDNHVTIYGTVRHQAFGGASVSGSATFNTVTLAGGTVWNGVYGGYVTSNNNATDNTVTLAGGTVQNGSVYGGFCQTCDDSNDVVSRNTLKLQGKSSKVSGEVGNFARIAFTLPDGFTEGSDPMLVITGTSQVDLTGIEIAIEDSIPALQHGSTLTLINKVKGTPKNTVITTPGYKFDLSIDNRDALVAAVTVLHPITYAITGNGSISCTPNPVPQGEKVTCTATPADGYKLELGDLSLPDTVNWKCDLAAMTCSTTSGVTSPLNVGATFTARNSGGNGSNGGSTGGGGGSAPTMSELGLLLSGLALAGAAAPALRRREKQGKKADTSK